MCNFSQNINQTEEKQKCKCQDMEFNLLYFPPAPNKQVLSVKGLGKSNSEYVWISSCKMVENLLITFTCGSKVLSYGILRCYA